MRFLFRFVVPVLLLVGAGVLAGCSINPQANSSIPWNRPADWEGQIPGMGTNGGGMGH